jgi:hypothetical protein
MHSSPFFERLVVDLLVRTGYAARKHVNPHTSLGALSESRPPVLEILDDSLNKG